MILPWIKNHKLILLLLLVISYLLWKSYRPPIIYNTARSDFSMPKSAGLGVGGGIGGAAPAMMERFIAPSDNYAPSPDVNDRMVIQNSYLSLLVKNVRETVDQILAYTTTNGGYMVNSSLEQPNESPTANVTIRIPAKNLTGVLDHFRDLSIKVVSENLTGEDVTDQYVDIEARLATLYKTKSKFEEIMDKAFLVQDILQVQREIINLQGQIDSYKGQQQYLSKSAQMAKVTIYLSTDELALPYAPSEVWRPNVIFKLAVRSLISNVRQLGTALIWLGVYAVIWIPALIIIFILKNRFRKE